MTCCRFRSRPAQIALCCLHFAVASVAFAQDRVQIKQGATHQGNITKLTPNEVVIHTRGKDQTFPMKDVRKIVFEKEPAELDRARELALDGKYQQALDQLKQVSRESMGENKRIREDYEFYRRFSEGMRSLAGSGDQMAAIRALVSFDKAVPDSHHRYSTKLLLGRLALARNEYDRSQEYFAELSKSSNETDKMTAAYYQAKALLQQGKPDDTKSRLEVLAKADTSSPEMARIKNLGVVLNARCDIEAGKADDAIKTLDALADREDNADLQLFAEINNARGAGYQKLNQPQRAAYSYLQTDLLFFTDPESHAEALYHLKKLLVAIGQPAKAADAGGRLANLYASSSWANRQ